MRNTFVLLASTLTALLLPVSAGAQPAIEFEWPRTLEWGLYNVGWEFQVSDASDIEVASLGTYDENRDGLTASHIVAIWPATGGMPLVSTTIPAGKEAILDGHFRYVNITPVRLIKGQQYIITASLYRGILDPTATDVFCVDPAGFTNAAAISLVCGRRTEWTTNEALFPDQIMPFNGEYGWFGPNFQFRPVPSIAFMTTRVSQIDIRWTSETDKVYRVQYKSAATANTWRDLTGNIPGTGTNNCISDPVPPGDSQRLYRVLTLP